jgi:hypothetical protein
MSIVPISSLSSSDLSILGNNIGTPARRRRRNLGPVNRSLAALGEQVKSLHRPRLSGTWSQFAPCVVTRRNA